MNSFMGKLEQILLPFASKLQSNKIMQSISSGLMSLMPVMMFGAFAALLKGIPINAYQQFLVASHLQALLNTGVDVTTNLLALYTSFAIANAYVSREGKDGVSAGFISLMSFILITPMTTIGEGYAAVTNLPLTWMGSTGLFAAMITAIVVSKLYVYFVNKNLVIKMPDGVPEFVSKSFAALVPAMIIVCIFALISYVLQFTPFQNLHQLIYGLIQAPLSGIGTSIWSALLIYILTQLCWFMGIHGMAIAMVIAPIWMAADAANMSAAAKGVANSDLPNIITNSWTGAIGNIGGAGATLGLVIWFAFRAKSKQYKTLGKMTLIPSFFNINEPVVFGLPCMLNPILFIPFVFLPALLIGIGYVLVKLGIMPVSSGIGAPMGTPVILAGFFNGGWRMSLFNIASIILSLIVYYPFFRILDKKALEAEKLSEVAVEAEQ